MRRVPGCAESDANVTCVIDGVTIVVAKFKEYQLRICIGHEFDRGGIVIALAQPIEMHQGDRVEVRIPVGEPHHRRSETGMIDMRGHGGCLKMYGAVRRPIMVSMVDSRDGHDRLTGRYQELDIDFIHVLEDEWKPTFVLINSEPAGFLSLELL